MQPRNLCCLIQELRAETQIADPVCSRETAEFELLETTTATSTVKPSVAKRKSKSAKSIYNKHLNNKIDVSSEIWKMINLELWYRQFID